VAEYYYMGCVGEAGILKPDERTELEEHLSRSLDKRVHRPHRLCVHWTWSDQA
jgi:hypothetical protein